MRVYTRALAKYHSGATKTLLSFQIKGLRRNAVARHFSNKLLGGRFIQAGEGQ